MNIPQQVNTFIRKHKLLKPGDKVILGVSGGPDSMALLSILDQLKHDLGVQIHIAHYNHQLRPSALRDQMFVEKTAKSMNIVYSVGKSRTLSKKLSGSLEEAARFERLKFFSKVKQKTGFHLIALAHTQDDLAETVLMRIIRGSGIQGLRAIQPYSEINQIKVIRPLLELTRDKIIRYLNQNQIPYKTDPTNRQLKFLRNKIRLKLLPLLEKEYNPKIKEALVNLSQTLSADFEFLQAKTADVFKDACTIDQKNQSITVTTAELLKQPDSLRRMLFRSIYNTLKGDTNRLEQKHILAVEKLLATMPEGSVVDWPYGICVKKTPEHLQFRIKE